MKKLYINRISRLGQRISKFNPVSSKIPCQKTCSTSFAWDRNFTTGSQFRCRYPQDDQVNKYEMEYIPRRALIYVPASNEKMLSKVDKLNADCVVLECEDGVSITRELTSGLIRLVIWIESARALLSMPKILSAAINFPMENIKLDACVFGSDDYCADIGATRSKTGEETMYARQRFVACCKAFGLQAIDSVFIDIKDMEGLKKQCEEGRAWGFTGKQVIHPSQVPVVQESFFPPTERIEWARELIHNFQEHEKTGKGAFVFRGQMIDMPLLKQARNVVNLSDKVITL